MKLLYFSCLFVFFFNFLWSSQNQNLFFQLPREIVSKVANELDSPDFVSSCHFQGLTDPSNPSAQTIRDEWVNKKLEKPARRFAKEKIREEDKIIPFGREIFVNPKAYHNELFSVITTFNNKAKIYYNEYTNNLSIYFSLINQKMLAPKNTRFSEVTFSGFPDSDEELKNFSRIILQKEGGSYHVEAKSNQDFRQYMSYLKNSDKKVKKIICTKNAYFNYFDLIDDDKELLKFAHLVEDFDYRSTLFFAINNFQLNLIPKSMLDKKLINKKDGNGHTVLHDCAKIIDKVKFLISHGANPIKKDSIGRTPLYYASIDTIPIFCLYEKIRNSRDYKEGITLEKGTVLHENIYSNIDDREKKTLIEFIKNGVPLNIKNKNGETALSLAVEYGLDDLVGQFLLYGANPNIKNEEGDTPLHKAVWLGRKNIARLLLNAGAKRDIVNNQSETPRDNMVRFNWEDLFIQEKSRINFKKIGGALSFFLVSGMLLFYWLKKK